MAHRRWLLTVVCVRCRTVLEQQMFEIPPSVLRVVGCDPCWQCSDTHRTFSLVPEMLPNDVEMKVTGTMPDPTTGRSTTWLKSLRRREVWGETGEPRLYERVIQPVDDVYTEESWSAETGELRHREGPRSLKEKNAEDRRAQLGKRRE